MARILDPVYRTCLYLAAALIAFMGAIILAQIVGRMFGTLVPSASEFAGYSMAASTFLALASVLRSDGHIRVQLIIERLPAAARMPLEFLVLGVSACMLAYFGWYSAQMALDAYFYGEMSPGLLPIPLYIPQAAMAFGLLLMAVACVEDLVSVVRGAVPSYMRHMSAEAGKITAKGE